MVLVWDRISHIAGTSWSVLQNFNMAPPELRGLHGASEDSEAALLVDLDIRKGPKGFGLRAESRFWNVLR